VQQVGEQLGDHEAERAAGLLELTGVAQLGLRRAVGDVDDAEHAEQQRPPADDLTARGAVGLGVAHVAPGDEAQQQRHEPRDQAHRAGDDRTGAGEDRAGQLPPHRGRHDHGQRDQEEPGTVATVLRLEVARTLADPASACAHSPGDAEPEAGDAVAHRAEDARDRARAAAHGARRGPLRLALASGRLALARAGSRGASRRSGPRA
jgi:hypothetical protein